MTTELLTSWIPCVWPGPGGNQAKDSWAELLDYLTRSIVHLCGTTYGLDDRGLEWLEDLALRRHDFKGRLILQVYPACATQRVHLQRLSAIASESQDRLVCRVLPVTVSRGAPITILWVRVAGNESRTQVVAGSGANFGLDDMAPGQVNVAFWADPVLTAALCKWFDEMWQRAAALTPDTVDIPPIVPGPTTPEAVHLWATYLEKCASPGALGETPEPERTAEPAVVTNIQPSPSEQAGFGYDELSTEIAKLYEKGLLVSIDKETRVPPLDVPIEARLLDVQGEDTIGAMSRKQSFRISALDEDTLKKLNARRRGVAPLLQRFSFSLADGQWWMPRAARALFEQELERLNREGQQLLERAVGGKPGDFVQTRRDQILRDAEKMYRRLHPRERLPKENAEEILRRVTERLDEAFRGRVAPLVSYAEVRFSPPGSSPSESESAWGQAFQLLKDIAFYPRNALTDPYFLRGLRVELHALLTAMDVCGDALVREWGRNRDSSVRERAWLESAALGSILQSKRDPKQKCEDILALIRGR